MPKTTDRLTVHIEMKPYLKAFLLSIYGDEPVFFPKRDKLNDLLQLLLVKPSKNHKPQKPDRKNSLEVILPYFENLNIYSYNHLSRRSQVSFVNFLKKRFWVTFEDFMNECARNGLLRSDAIDLFIEKYNLPYHSGIYDMLNKATYRSKVISKKYPTRQYHKRKKHNKSLSDNRVKIENEGNSGK